MNIYAPDHPEHTCGPVTPVDKAVDPETLVQAETAFLLIQGMGCPVCAMRVHNGLLRLDGVLAVEVALTPGLARVRYDPAQVTPEAFPEAVAEAGNDSPHHYSAHILV
jgi:copper chaperone